MQEEAFRLRHRNKVKPAGATTPAGLEEGKDKRMWNEGSLHHEMMGWGDNSWHWLFGFHGIMSALFLIVIVVLLALLVRDSRRDHGAFTKPATRDDQPRNHTGEASVETHLVRRS